MEFLFVAHSEASMSDWVNKVSFHAALPPSLQLLSYDEARRSAGFDPSQGVAGEFTSAGAPSAFRFD